MTDRAREPAQALYVGAHLFDERSVARAGTEALAQLDRWAPDEASFAAAMALPDREIAARVQARVRERLATAPVDALRVDFEDGYGVHADSAEDAVADRVGAALVRARDAGAALGARLKPLLPETRARSERTLERLLHAVAREAEGAALPASLTVCIAKVGTPAHTAAAARQLAVLERSLGLPGGWATIEPMLEQPQAILGGDGRVIVRDIVEAGEGRVRSVQFGVYDYTASVGVPAAHQHLRHPACDLARGLVQMALAGTDVQLVDGSTAQLPVAPDGADETTARIAVHGGWTRHADDVRHSLAHGWYSGCDLHSTQLASRWAAVLEFYLSGVDASAARLARFLAKAEQATVVGAQFDDAATVQGLLASMARAVGSGAVTAGEVERVTGLTGEDLADPVVGRVIARRTTRADASPRSQ